MKKDKSIFAKALAETVIPEILDESVPLDCEHEFSDKFERRMSKIMKKSKTSHHKIISISRNFGVGIAAAMVITSGLNMLTDALRAPAIDYVVLHYSTNDDVRVKFDEDYNFPKKIEEEYTIDIPEGFELKEEIIDEISVNRRYENNGQYIELQQRVVGAEATGIDNEHGINDIITDEDGIKYVIHFDDEEKYYMIMWSNDIYMFTLYTNISGETAFDLCKSTKIK